MQFNKKTHKVKLSTLNEDEAAAFVAFLWVERDRHKWAIEDAKFKSEAGDETDLTLEDEAYINFWQSAILRHREDIINIDKLIQKLKERFGWE